MATVRFSPAFNEQVVTSAGAPASGYLLYTYAAGSTTAQTTYTTSAGTVAQANPIVLNANGAPDNPIWLTAGQSYKFVLKDSGGVTIRTVDNVAGVNDTSVSVSQWVSSGVTPTYVSASSFTLVGDQTSEFHVGRRVQCTVTAGTVYGVIATSAYTTLTTVTVTLDSGSLDSGLSAVNLSLLRADNSALPKRAYSATTLDTSGNATVGGTLGVTGKVTAGAAVDFAASASVASASTTDIGAAASNNVTVTGTTTITSLGTAAAGIRRTVTFSGALTLTHNATSLILPGSANIVTVAGDSAEFLSLGSGNWRCVDYQRVSGGLPSTTGSAPAFACRAWGQVANSGTASLTAGGNISGVSRGAIGEVAVSFTTAMPSANYAVSITGANSTIAAGARSGFVKDGSKTTGGFTVFTIYDGAPTAGVDCNFDFIVFG